MPAEGVPLLSQLAPTCSRTTARQAGAKLSQKIHGEWIIRSLALALGLVGIRLLSQSLW